MKGADEYYELFRKAEQIGRLYLLPSSHARGPTFRLYVLPAGEDVIENGGFNPPLNKEAVEVYGVTGGQLGWTERYGWIHRGAWQDDFNSIVEKKKAAQDAARKLGREQRAIEEVADRDRLNFLLSEY